MLVITLNRYYEDVSLKVHECISLLLLQAINTGPIWLKFGMEIDY